MQRARLIVNPQATATSARARDVLINALSAETVVEVTETKARGHAEELAHDARIGEYDVVIALGGDGTVNEIVNGLLADGLDDTVPALAVVPGGSTNVFARAVGLPDDHIEATGQLLEALRDNRRRRIGLGRADGRWFTFTAGLGLDAEVVERVEQRRAKGKRSTHSLYLRSAFGQYLRRTDRRSSPLALDCPGDPVEQKQSLVLVGNTSPWTFLGRLRVDPFPGASFDLGLDLLALHRLRPLTTLATAGQLLTPNGRKPWGDQVVHRHDLAALAVTADYPVAFQVDGDYLGERDHVVFTSVPRALAVVV
jgi:diacylglycerol kinase family enzyme